MVLDIVKYDSLIDFDKTILQLEGKLKEYFFLNSIIDDIPYINWWIKTPGGEVLRASKTARWYLDNLTEQQLQAFYEIYKVSDHYALTSFNLDGTRRPVLFYEILDIPDCDCKGLWQTLKLAIPIDEKDDSKVYLFGLSFMHELLHGSYENAMERFNLLKENKLVTRITDNIYISRKEGHNG
jgi:hypothetical protein